MQKHPCYIEGIRVKNGFTSKEAQGYWGGCKIGHIKKTVGYK
ncbi:MAG: hypothetical protein OEY59_13560 [Deltaproteobacteria bacterium]|nr:hypothetical protein [Deltaproteobacteria bacterium]